MLEAPNQQALQAVLFHIALWHLDLGGLARGLHHGWPQCDAGIVLWSLSVAANDWQPREQHFYRKTALFDRLLSFDVALEDTVAPRH